MDKEREEPNHVIGMPRWKGPQARQGEEPQHVLGVPVDWFAPVDPRIRLSRHPIRACKRWLQIRRLGSCAPDEEPPPSK
jgi:hypothetical protein